jgi:hypothetical protein
VFLHHAAGVYPSGVEAMRRIQRQHQDTNGWADYGYSFGVWDDGQIYEGRGWGAQGGHTRGHNSTGVAVCYMGDGRRPVPQVALDAILVAVADADRYFGRPLDRRAHRDVGATQCPGDWLYGWWEANKAPKPPVVSPVEDSPAPAVPVREDSEVSSPVISERPSPIPDLRDGWRRHMDRSGWLRRP